MIALVLLALVASGGVDTGTTGLLWPVGSGEKPFPILHQFGQYIDYYGDTTSGYYDGTLHLGLDIVAPEGEAVYAIEKGVVVFSAASGAYTHQVIRTEAGKGHIYTHLSPESLQFDEGDEVAADDYLGDVYGEYESDPVHPSHLHLGNALLRGDEWVEVGNPMTSLTGLQADIGLPEVLGSPGKEVHFFPDDGSDYADPTVELDASELPPSKVDVVVQIEEEFLGKNPLTPYRVMLSLLKGGTVQQEWYLELDGPLTGSDADVLFHEWSKGGYKQRAFYLILTNGGDTPTTRPDVSGHLDLSELGGGTYELEVKVWDVRAISVSADPATLVYTLEVP